MLMHQSILRTILHWNGANDGPPRPRNFPDEWESIRSFTVAIRLPSGHARADSTDLLFPLRELRLALDEICTESYFPDPEYRKLRELEGKGESLDDDQHSYLTDQSSWYAGLVADKIHGLIWTTEKQWSELPARVQAQIISDLDSVPNATIVALPEEAAGPDGCTEQFLMRYAQMDRLWQPNQSELPPGEARSILSQLQADFE